MRNRSNSAVRLDYYYRMIYKTILQYQNPVTGLLPAKPFDEHAWVRENVYSALAIWGLSLAYKKSLDVNEDRARCYELEQSTVKLMRGLLTCMLHQRHKVERFKVTESTNDAIHAMFSVRTGREVVGDNEWGHLQMDATSLFLLILAQMTATGLQIIYTLDEVDFIQNLVFYIRCAYTVPDFGIWERGDKSNTGLPELNCTSVGMAKAALEAMSEIDLFGRKGSPASVIHVHPDDISRCRAILASVLPRESNSKETDAGLLSIIGFPAFAVDDPALVNATKNMIVEKLQGQYGLCRFLKDGFKTVKEDTSRIFYEPWELQSFENIECEWPVFFAFLILDGLFAGNKEQVEEYSHALDGIMIKRGDGIKLIPELYAVPDDKVELEFAEPKSQERVPLGRVPLMWAQSLYVLGRLLKEGFLSPGELDPLSRRLVAEPRYETVIQVAFLAEDSEVKEKVLHSLDIPCLTFDEVAPIRVFPARILKYIFSSLGTNTKLSMHGIKADVAGILATSRFYSLEGYTIVFLPNVSVSSRETLCLKFVDEDSFYPVHDVDLFCDVFGVELLNIKQNWNFIGRPLFIFPWLHWMTDQYETIHPCMVSVAKRLMSGYKFGAKVQVGKLSEFVNTSATSSLSFLTMTNDGISGNVIMQTIADLAFHHRQTSLIQSTVVEPLSHEFVVDTRHRSLISARIGHSVTSDKLLSERTDVLHKLKPVQPTMQPGEVQNEEIEDELTEELDKVTDLETGLLFKKASESFSKSHLKESTGVAEKITSTDELQYAGRDLKDLIENLEHTTLLHEQVDMIHYLYYEKGLDWTIVRKNGTTYTVRDLMMELYDKAARFQQWWLLRHTAGILGKRAENLDSITTDIIIRQKQITFGLPPEPREKIITRPLPSDDLAALINEACENDWSVAMLTQEVLFYLSAIFVTQPKAFSEIINIRVGLIIQVMVSELAQLLKIPVADASQELMNLSPFEIQMFLTKVIMAKEYSPGGDGGVAGKKVKDAAAEILRSKRRRSSAESVETIRAPLGDKTDRLGRWLRRRQLDGSLGRVPVGFYTSVWNVLNRCPEILFEKHSLKHSLTKESTSGEMKFACQVEAVLNHISSPEYRQLFIEAAMVFCMMAELLGKNFKWETSINVGEIVHNANRIFIDEQEKLKSDVTLCCAIQPRPSTPPCGGHAGICQYFYDSAPTGRWGTMVYMVKAAASLMQLPTGDTGNINCVQQ